MFHYSANAIHIQSFLHVLKLWPILKHFLLTIRKMLFLFIRKVHLFYFRDGNEVRRPVEPSVNEDFVHPLFGILTFNLMFVFNCVKDVLICTSSHIVLIIPIIMPRNSIPGSMFNVFMIVTRYILNN